jgi:OPT family oligopeptide transporter
MILDREPSPPPIDTEAAWLANVYKPDEPNLTVRAVLAGALIGAVMCLSNLYVFFKTGWSQGVTITACILAYALFGALRASGAVRRPLGVLENNALTTVASGAGYMTGGGNMAAFGALMMLTAVRPHALPTIAWFAVIAALGVFAAIPIKRQLINKEGLAFPTGTATAETIRSIHGGTAVGTSQAKILGLTALFAAAVALLRDAVKILPGTLSLPVSLAGHRLATWTLALKTEVILIGAGALMSFRTCWSLLLGAVLTYGVAAPKLVADGIVTKVSYKEIVAWTLWPGAAMLVGAGLTTFALDYKSLGRAFAGIAQLFRGKREDGEAAHGIAAVEAPDWWFPAGFAVLSPIVILLMATLFQIPVWAGLIAVPLAVVMGFIAARVTGETDVTPTKALGPVTQMLFGALTPGNLTGNIMSANVTGGVGLHAADLLTTQKTGWLLGAKPRHQLYAQLCGVVVGALVVVPAFLIIIPDPSVLGGDAWPAPSCTVWAGVSQAFSHGLGNLQRSSQIALLAGLSLGIFLTLLEKVSPARVKRFLPTANGLGLSMVIPGSNSVAMFLGSAIAEGLRRRRPDLAERYVVPTASGLIAGESLMGIVIAILIVAGVLAK